jgi:predicted metal-dependent phosphoesterase TrpH
MFDLHFHSRASDGKADFATVCAAVRGHPELALVALTDHDAIADSARLADLEPRAWVGAELSGFVGATRVDILGLNLRPDNPELRSHLAARTRARRERFALFGLLLRQAGWVFEPETDTLASPQLGLPHVAQELRRHMDNRPAFLAAGLAPDEASVRVSHGQDAIYPLLLEPLDTLIIERMTIKPASSVDLIGLVHRAGGLALVAHPWIEPFDFGTADPEAARAIIAVLVEAGLDGLERWHPDQVSDEAQQTIAGLCRRYDLAESAGSDDHRADLSALGSMSPGGYEARQALTRLQAAAQRRRQGPAAR